MSDIKETSAFLKQMSISGPTIILDEAKSRENIRKMVHKARSSAVDFRPHFKTHNSETVGSWFKEQGVNKIAVSSVDMALNFANCGWDDITLAFPVDLLRIQTINKLAVQLKLNLLVDSIPVVTALESRLTQPADVWIKVDIGYGRAGILWNEPQAIRDLYHKIELSDMLRFAGILTHSGQVYQAHGADEIRTIYDQTVSRLEFVKEFLTDYGVSDCVISIGDTPCCSVVSQFKGIDEIRPGNFVFYDLMQQQLGACTADDIAVAVACPVVGKRAHQHQIIVHGGAVHFSKEYLTVADGRKSYGYVTYLADGTLGPIMHQTSLISLSQEHGIIQTDPAAYEQISIADLLLIYPVHSCLTCDLTTDYLTITNQVVKRFKS